MDWLSYSPHFYKPHYYCRLKMSYICLQLCTEHRHYNVFGDGDRCFDDVIVLIDDVIGLYLYEMKNDDGGDDDCYCFCGHLVLLGHFCFQSSAANEDTIICRYFSYWHFDEKSWFAVVVFPLASVDSTNENQLFKSIERIFFCHGFCSRFSTLCI